MPPTAPPSNPGRVCPDGACTDGEDCGSCPADCGPCAAACNNGNCEAGETTASCPGDCPAGATCPDGACGAGEDCRTCAADCGACPADCGGRTCGDGERCVVAPGDGASFCTRCDPAACGAFGTPCCPQNAETGECTNWWTDRDNCGGCGVACAPGAFCVSHAEPVFVGPFCTACDPAACGAFGVICCPDGAATGECTNQNIDRFNCGGCGVRCPESELCVGGVCQAPTVQRACAFDPQQWWASPETQDDRDITFVAFADTHATELHKPQCGSVLGVRADGNVKMRMAIASLVPSVFWAPHVWPAGADFANQGRPFDHVRGAIIAGDLTQSGDEAIPVGSDTCYQYRNYRDAYGQCGDEGRLPFPVYDGYGNHDFPRFLPDGPQHQHPVVDALDRFTAALRPGVEGDFYEDPMEGTGHYAWRWDGLWFVMLDLKTGSELTVDQSESGTRHMDPHNSVRFLRRFLETRSNDAQRQIVIITHMHMGAEDVLPEDKDHFCQLIANAQRGDNGFDGPKLDATHPIAAHLHGHNHHAPERNVWRCPAPYDGVSFPSYSVGTPLYMNPHNTAANGDNPKLQFTVFRFGDRNVEAVGFGAPVENPTGEWQVIYTHRDPILNAP